MRSGCNDHWRTSEGRKVVLGSNGAVVHYGLGVSAAVIPQLYSYYFVTVVRIEEMFMGMDIF